MSFAGMLNGTRSKTEGTCSISDTFDDMSYSGIGL